MISRHATRLAILGWIAFMAGCGVSRWPTNGPLAAPFGMRWDGALPDVHKGVDIVVVSGTPVAAMAPGRVRFSGTMEDYGLVVWLDHDDEVVTVYAHLSELRVASGNELAKGAILGLSGSTGNASGPHPHFEIWRRGIQIDPVAMLGGPPGP